MDISLVEQLQQTEEGRLRRFFLRRLRNREDAADATQETFLRLLTAAPKEDLRNPHAYLFQVAKSVAHGVTARLMRDSALFSEDLDQTQVADDAPSPERVVAARQQLALLIETILALPPKCRVVFVLSRLEGLSNGEIAEKLGVSRNMVEKHIIRALMACRQARQAALPACQKGVHG
ncbi:MULTISPECIES: sigma-70 family RNA polymerase sigma factor [Rhizobium/Agrobacterium group]|uniref:Sigma-70 family RNA polymerase sigma factor n=1 Tax=Neorhizobium petrolearium TaxID=515361 RepID=A0ABY8M756_9HYPH|nr:MULTISPECIES: sigma-70 family RNA polymerase sigma factor [Rhizobium/Agrobacterium group]MCC2609347.1 sigma-70 family RNA polymerase sigma factor [Neorhizobium petrolearium]WGI69564.1 sigma-70 family RNA polymerase sigma factor [Neorhizobium petrolearium]